LTGCSRSEGKRSSARAASLVSAATPIAAASSVAAISHENLRASFPPARFGTICSGMPCGKKRAHTQLVHSDDSASAGRERNALRMSRVRRKKGLIDCARASVFGGLTSSGTHVVYVMPSTLSVACAGSGLRAWRRAPMRERPSTAAATRIGTAYSPSITAQGTAHRAPYSWASCQTM
jgi:hypothetical protein